MSRQDHAQLEWFSIRDYIFVIGQRVLTLGVPLLTTQTATVCPGMATGYLPLASGIAGGLESHV